MVGIETYAGGDLELSALHLYSADTRVDATATLTSSHAPIAGTLANLQDDNTATVCRFAGAAVRSAGFALVWDFGAGNAFGITNILPGSGGDKDAFLSSCLLQSSADGRTWSSEEMLGRYPWPGANSMYAPEYQEGDDYFPNVVALLHMDSYHGQTTITDETGRVWSRAGSGALLSTDKSKFGAAALRITDSGSDFNTAPGILEESDLFTIEGWFYLLGAPFAPAAQQHPLVTQGRASSCGAFGLFVNWADMKLYMDFRGGNCSEVGAAGVTSTILNTWYSFALTWDGTTYRCFLNGGLEFAVAKSFGWKNTGYPMRIGRMTEDSSQWERAINGYIDEVRITKGVARYTSSYTPPNKQFPNSVGGLLVDAFGPHISHTTRSRPAIAASAPVPAHTTRSASRLQMARDVEVGGQGTIYGTTKTAGAQGAPGTPTKARVVLLHQRSKLPVREMWSDPVTGDYAFHGIDTSQQFLVLAEDAQGDFRPVAANRLTPEVQP